MSNFQVNDIIKEYVACNINKIIFIENYGLITNIQDNNVTTLWGDENKIINLQQNWYMCKKITDNDWIDKDGKHYFNNGYTTDYAFQKLREERDKKLDETDYIIREDYPNPIDSIKQEWYTYRQELRDLPATSNPQLDTNGQLINVTWSILPS